MGCVSLKKSGRTAARRRSLPMPVVAMVVASVVVLVVLAVPRVHLPRSSHTTLGRGCGRGSEEQGESDELAPDDGEQKQGSLQRFDGEIERGRQARAGAFEGGRGRGAGKCRFRDKGDVVQQEDVLLDLDKRHDGVRRQQRSFAFAGHRNRKEGRNVVVSVTVVTMSGSLNWSMATLDSTSRPSSNWISDVPRNGPSSRSTVTKQTELHTKLERRTKMLQQLPQPDGASQNDGKDHSVVQVKNGTSLKHELEGHERAATGKTIEVIDDISLSAFASIVITSSADITIRGKCGNRRCKIVAAYEQRQCLTYYGSETSGGSILIFNLEFVDLCFQLQHANVELHNCVFRGGGRSFFDYARRSSSGELLADNNGAPKSLIIDGCFFRDIPNGVTLVELPQAACISRSRFTSRDENDIQKSDILVVRTTEFIHEKVLRILNCTLGQLGGMVSNNVHVGTVTSPVIPVSDAASTASNYSSSPSPSPSLSVSNAHNTSIYFIESQFSPRCKVYIHKGSNHSSEPTVPLLHFCSSFVNKGELEKVPVTRDVLAVNPLNNNGVSFCSGVSGGSSVDVVESTNSSQNREEEQRAKAACHACDNYTQLVCNDTGNAGEIWPELWAMPPPPIAYSDGAYHHVSNQLSVLLMSILITISLALCLIGTWRGIKRFVRRRSRRGKNDHGLPPPRPQYENFVDEVLNLRDFPLKELREATQDFTTVVGRGGSGVVYRARLETDEVVAVKSLKREHWRNEQEFLHEVRILGRIAHRNLVSLLGFCHEDERYCLVYEFLPNGTLRDHLHSKGDETTGPATSRRHFLDWPTRVRIAREVASALEYLHHLLKPPLVHRDIKPENVLLLDDCTPKVTDFGLCRKFDQGDDSLLTNPAGTIGYMAPEIWAGLSVTEKVDVFSFGVLLLELITGKRPFSKDFALVEWVKAVAQDVDSTNGIADPRLQGELDPTQLYLMTVLARRCLHQRAERRPSMQNVARALERIDEGSARNGETRNGESGDDDGIQSLRRVLEAIRTGTGGASASEALKEWHTASDWLSALYVPRDIRNCEEEEDGHGSRDEETGRVSAVLSRRYPGEDGRDDRSDEEIASVSAVVRKRYPWEKGSTGHDYAAGRDRDSTSLSSLTVTMVSVDTTSYGTSSR